MAEAVVYSKEGKETGKENLVPAVFEHQVNDHLLYEYVNAYLANQRQGTAKTKGRSEVSGGTSKPWRQKGTGRARAGSNTSPVWVRGGKAFGPTPRDYTVRLPRKKKAKAMIHALSVRAVQEGVKIIESIALKEPKTKEVNTLLGNMSLAKRKNLFIVDEYDKNLELSARNIHNTSVRRVRNLNPYDVLNCENLIFTKQSLSKLQEKLSKKESA